MSLKKNLNDRSGTREGISGVVSTTKAIYSTTSKKGQVVSWCLDYLSGFYGDFANFKLWTACHKIYNSLNDKYMYFYVSKHHNMFPLDQQYVTTGVMAASEIPPQMANFQILYRAAFYFFLAAKTAHWANCYFVLNFSLLAPKTAYFGI